MSQSTLDLYALCDADWAGYPSTRRSTSSFYTILGSNYVSWSPKNQIIVARSSVEAEYKAMAATTVELTWLSILLRDLVVPLKQAPILHYDNSSSLYLIVNPSLHTRTKHINLNYHYICEHVAIGALETRYVTFSQWIADIFTKPLLKQPLW